MGSHTVAIRNTDGTSTDVNIPNPMPVTVVSQAPAQPTVPWSYAAASGGILNSTAAVTIKTAVAGQRNYITNIQVSAEALASASELVVRDGSGGPVLFRIKVGTAAFPLQNVALLTPIRSSVNTLLEVALGTATGTGAVYVNAQGYVA